MTSPYGETKTAAMRVDDGGSRPADCGSFFRTSRTAASVAATRLPDAPSCLRDLVDTGKRGRRALSQDLFVCRVRRGGWGAAVRVVEDNRVARCARAKEDGTIISDETPGCGERVGVGGGAGADGVGAVSVGSCGSPSGVCGTGGLRPRETHCARPKHALISAAEPFVKRGLPQDRLCRRRLSPATPRRPAPSNSPQ